MIKAITERVKVRRRCGSQVGEVFFGVTAIEPSLNKLLFDIIHE
jgi:hypothetical protein